MIVFIGSFNKLFILLLSLNNFVIIFADNNKCPIEHCYKCPEQGKCSICENGYKLTFEQNKCVPENEDNKNTTESTKKSGSASLEKKSDSEAKASGSKKSSLSSVKKASNSQVALNAPTASNKPRSSVFELNKDLIEDNSKWIKICICISIVILIIICIMCFCCKKKKVKVGYFYDESGNPNEKARVVYIK